MYSLFAPSSFAGVGLCKNGRSEAKRVDSGFFHAAAVHPTIFSSFSQSVSQSVLGSVGGCSLVCRQVHQIRGVSPSTAQIKPDMD